MRCRVGLLLFLRGVLNDSEVPSHYESLTVLLAPSLSVNITLRDGALCLQALEAAGKRVQCPVFDTRPGPCWGRERREAVDVVRVNGGARIQA
jgi:hypothetical protein